MSDLLPHHKSIRVFFVQHCANHTGSAISGQIITQGFRNRGWSVDVAFGFNGPCAAQYAELGCAVHVVPHKSWLRGGNWLYSARQIAKEWSTSRTFVPLLARLRPDVVYINSIVSLAAAVAARQMRIPCIWHLRELFDDLGGEMHVPAAGGRYLVRRLLRKLSLFRIAISQIVAENILGVSEEPHLEIIPNAVDDEFVEFSLPQATCRTELKLPLDVPLIGVPGTLRPVKGHPFFFQAAAQLVKTCPECRFAITGDGNADYVAELRKQVQLLGLTDRTIFLGNTPEMARFYRACDLVCVPSISESFGRTVIESFAVGTPVIATAVGGMLETITNNQTGLLVPYGDAAELSLTLNRLVRDPSLQRQLAAAGRIEVERRYSAQAHQQRICQLVERSISSPRIIPGELVG